MAAIKKKLNEASYFQCNPSEWLWSVQSGLVVLVTDHDNLYENIWCSKLYSYKMFTVEVKYFIKSSCLNIISL